MPNFCEAPSGGLPRVPCSFWDFPVRGLRTSPAALVEFYLVDESTKPVELSAEERTWADANDPRHEITILGDRKGNHDMRRTNDFEHQPWRLTSIGYALTASFRRWNLALIGILTFIALGVFAIILTSQPGHAASPTHSVSLKIDANPVPVSLADLKNGYSAVIGPALPAVVNISSTKVVKIDNNFPRLFFGDPFFRQFFGDQFDHSPAPPQTEREHSLGSGVIVNPDGYVLTNDHVVSGASDIEVFTRDKKEFRAKVIGTDSQTDVAVLKINATGLPSLTLGDSSQLQVGDVVFAIGDPFGVGETATMGIVSATGRGLGVRAHLET
jgi:Trypsin-like peptidase domain